MTSVDLDVFLELNENYEIVVSLQHLQNAGLATEVVTAPEQDTDRLLLGIDRWQRATLRGTRRTAIRRWYYFRRRGRCAVFFYLLEQLDSSELGNGCIAPISASESCPESYSDVIILTLRERRLDPPKSALPVVLSAIRGIEECAEPNP